VCADPVRSSTRFRQGAPVSAALDAESGAKSVMDCVTKKVRSRRRVKILLLQRRAEEDLELRTSRPKFSGGRERDIALQAARYEKHPINARAAGQVKQMHAAEFFNDSL
jgi:hypothetical protein